MLLQEQQKVTAVLIRRRPILIFLCHMHNADCYTGNFSMITCDLDCFGNWLLYSSRLLMCHMLELHVDYSPPPKNCKSWEQNYTVFTFSRASKKWIILFSWLANFLRVGQQRREVTSMAGQAGVLGTGTDAIWLKNRTLVGCLAVIYGLCFWTPSEL